MEPQSGFELFRQTRRKSRTKEIQERMQWHRHFLKLAEVVAEKSKDPSMQVGCVIVGPDKEIRSTGYNGFCRGIEYTNERMARPEKYLWIEHGERNAIYNAARIGVSLKGCTAYIACLPRGKGGNMPCCDCMRALIQAGITHIVEWNQPSAYLEGASDWRGVVDRSEKMLKEAGVQLTLITREDEQI